MQVAHQVQIAQWKGLVSHRGLFPSEPGEASVQTNLRAIQPGELSSRNNAESISFTLFDGDVLDEEVPAAEFMSLSVYQTVSTQFVIAQIEAGSIYAFRLS